MFGAKLRQNHFLLFKSSLGLSLSQISSQILHPVFLVLSIGDRMHKEIKRVEIALWAPLFTAALSPALNRGQENSQAFHERGMCVFLHVLKSPLGV